MERAKYELIPLFRFLFENGYVGSLQTAKRMIYSGKIKVNGSTELDPLFMVMSVDRIVLIKDM